MDFAGERPPQAEAARAGGGLVDLHRAVAREMPSQPSEIEPPATGLSPASGSLCACGSRVLPGFTFSGLFFCASELFAAAPLFGP